ncbi:MAG: hypothetical protein Q4F97_01745 [Bacteroidales bacterium]|nr:hypothetical protein [Bacteroidales bacterium]
MIKHVLILIEIIFISGYSCIAYAQDTFKHTFLSSHQSSYVTWAVKDITSSLPNNWNEYNYLTINLKVSSPQLIFMSLITKNGTFTQGIQPLSCVGVKFVIPLDYYRLPPESAHDMAATYKKWQPMGMINIGNPNIGKLEGVDSIRFIINSPVNNPEIEIYPPFILSKDKPESKLIDNTIAVDKYGQWIVDEYNKKHRAEQDIFRIWNSEKNNLNNKFPDGFTSFGGVRSIQREKTGYFRKEKIDGKWWFIDPDGYPFLSSGVCCVRLADVTNTKDREYIFENKPKEQYVSFYKENIMLRYGKNWLEKWMDNSVKRMKNWGINSIGNWSLPELFNKKFPFTMTIEGLFINKFIMGLPDIYDENYKTEIAGNIKNTALKFKNNKWLIGYFIGNEQPWPGQEELLCKRIIDGKDTPMKEALISYLSQNGDTKENRKQFIYITFDKFLSYVNDMLKRYDPNHLNLGIRFGGNISDELISMAGKHFDVFSFNCYNIRPNDDYINRVAKISNLPSLIGEFHFGVPANGLASGLVSVEGYKQRGEAYSYYVENGYSNPNLIGIHWFQWIDEPVTGRPDGENYNIGFVDVTDCPYPFLTESAKESFKRIYDIHQGKIRPTDKCPRYRLQ